MEESIKGGYTAKALGVSIYTDANTIEELRNVIKDAVLCHFEEDDMLNIITTVPDKVEVIIS